MKKLFWILLCALALFGKDLVIFENEYTILHFQKPLQKIIVGSKDMINVSLLDKNSYKMLKIFGKKAGNTSILLIFQDNSMQNYHVYINQNLGYIEKMIHLIEPSLKLNRVGAGSTVLTGTFQNPHNKSRIYTLLEKAGIDMKSLMDLTTTLKVNKMVRTKLYLVEINNNKAKDLGGAVGLGLVSKNSNIHLNPTADTSATFSGWLLDNFSQFTSQTGSSITATLHLLEQKGVGKILDDTVLITTEDENATFRIGGEVYIPIGMTQNIAGLPPTIQLEEKKYGLRLNLTTKFMEQKDYLYLHIVIKDSAFDPNKEHNVKLGENVEVPSFISKNMITNIVVKSKQIIALGGRLHTEDIEQEDKIPLLGDIPVIGNLFKRKVRAKKANDLLFFLVPEIIDANNQIDDRNFYNTFKNDSLELHKDFLLFKKEEDNSSKSDTNSTNIKSSDANSTNSKEQNSSIAIEIIDENRSVNEPQKEQKSDENLSTKELSIELQTHNKQDYDTNSSTNKSDTKETTDESLQKTQATALQTTTLTKQQTIQNKEQDSNQTGVQVATDALEETNQFAIAAPYLYVRNNPGLQSKRVSVWREGHTFVAGHIEKVDGIEWIEVVKDCKAGICIELKEPLWISKKYTFPHKNNK